MNIYLVRLKIRIGEYEKCSVKVIRAPEAEKAGEYALYSESHCCDTLEWDEGRQGLYDDGGGMHYSVTGIRKLAEREKEVLLRIFNATVFNQEELDNAGNYGERQ